MNDKGNTILRLDHQRGKRMTEEAAKRLLVEGGYTIKLREFATAHRDTPSETVLTHWATEDYSKTATTISTFSV